MKQAKEKEVALLYLDNNNLKSLNKGLERDIKKLEKLLSLTSDTCEQQVNELMEQQKEINDLNKKLNNWRNISTLKLKKLVVLRERLDIANEFRAIVKELKRTR